MGKTDYVLFFFLYQFIKNKIPIKNAGPAIIKDQESIYHSLGVDIITLEILKPVYNNPAKMKAIPPTISCFQEIIKIIIRANDGMLCINNPTIVPQKPYPLSNMSKENRLKKRINIIDNILGVQ